MNKSAILILGSALAVGACASERQAAFTDPYAAALYTGAPQPDRADHFALLYAPDQSSANGTPFELVSYAGIEGARRAHLLYTEEEAEALDGRCERYVEPTKTESLIDIAKLCDVKLDMLVAYNPDINSVSYGAPGAVIEIPGGSVAPQGTFAMKDALAGLYSVQEGDTLESIAWRLNVSQASIANLNPDVYWSEIAPGDIIRRPVAAPAASASGSYAPAAPAPAWEGWSGGAGIGASEAGSVVALAPYGLAPVKNYARPKGVYPDATLDVDRSFVNVGENVKVTAKAAPGSEVTFYYGDDPASMKRSKTARADQNGEATASIRVRKSSNMGGVIFGARPEGSRETQFSDRVGVVKLKPRADTGAADESETEDEDAE